MEEANNVFRICIQSKGQEMPLQGWVTIQVLEEVFYMECDICQRCVMGILGLEVLYLALSRPILPSQVLSYFLTYIVDLLLDMGVVEHITDKVV